MQDNYYEPEYTAIEEELIDTINSLELRIWELERELEDVLEKLDKQAYYDSFVD